MKKTDEKRARTSQIVAYRVNRSYIIWRARIFPFGRRRRRRPVFWRDRPQIGGRYYLHAYKIYTIPGRYNNIMLLYLYTIEDSDLVVEILWPTSRRFTYIYYDYYFVFITLHAHTHTHTDTRVYNIMCLCV